MAKGNLLNPDGPHLSESNFRRWESILSSFLSTYPEPFSFTPAELKPSSCVVSLRNAVNAVLSKDFPTTLDRAVLADVWKKVTVCAKGTRVVIGDREAQKTSSIEIARESFSSRGPTFLTIPNPSERVLLAVAILFSERALTDPVTFSGDVPPFTPPPGVVFEPMPDGTYTML